MLVKETGKSVEAAKLITPMLEKFRERSRLRENAERSFQDRRVDFRKTRESKLVGEG
nr:hypothetical protein [Methylocystis sp. H62]